MIVKNADRFLSLYDYIVALNLGMADLTNVNFYTAPTRGQHWCLCLVSPYFDPCLTLVCLAAG